MARVFRTPPAETAARLGALVAERRRKLACARADLAAAEAAGAPLAKRRRIAGYVALREQKLAEAERRHAGAARWSGRMARESAELAAWRAAVGR